MLFTAWRDEDGLKGQSDSHEKEYQRKEIEINCSRMMFAQYEEELYKAANEINEEILMESVDKIAPSSRQTEEDACTESTEAVEHSSKGITT
ncbi:hypothetical protein ACF0H5_003296 [Mactra antiquata]